MSGPIARHVDARGVVLLVRVVGGCVVAMQGHERSVAGDVAEDVIALDDAETVRWFATALLEAADAMPEPRVGVAGAPMLLPTGTESIR